MSKLKWFLVGFLFCLVFTDWLRLRSVIPSWRVQIERSAEVAEQQEKVSQDCMGTLSRIHQDLDQADERAKLTLMARVRAVRELQEKYPNNPRIKKLVVLSEELERVDDAEGGGQVDLLARQVSNPKPR